MPSHQIARKSSKLKIKFKETRSKREKRFTRIRSDLMQYIPPRLVDLLLRTIECRKTLHIAINFIQTDRDSIKYLFRSNCKLWKVIGVNLKLWKAWGRNINYFKVSCLDIEFDYFYHFWHITDVIQIELIFSVNHKLYRVLKTCY